MKHPRFANDLWPIALCNVLYKILAKLIANHLKAILPVIIDQSQGRFVSERGAIDNAIFVFETIHPMLKKCTRIFSASQSMAIKIDMSKAYDRIS